MSKSGESRILIVNAGSSSIRFAIYDFGPPFNLLLQGKIDRIGLSGTRLNAIDALNDTSYSSAVSSADHESVAAELLAWLAAQAVLTSIVAVGHRLVHGTTVSGARLITAALIDELGQAASYNPEHLPLQIALIHAFDRDYPEVPQVACFDCAFHHDMPRVAHQLPLPRQYEAAGIRRYGYHGLSCEFLLQELQRLDDPAATEGRVILAHLGNGASMTAVRAGKCIDTSMGLTPTGGLMMGSRSGDLDPGLQVFFARTQRLNGEQFYAMVNRESGLLGVSEISSDLQELLQREADDVRAAEAIDLFCYHATKLIGAYAAALGGLDTIVFAGGIGENVPEIRKRICANLEFLGISLEQKRNIANAPMISADKSSVNVRVIATNEELMIARSLVRVLEMEGAS